MHKYSLGLTLGLALASAAPAPAQHAQVSAVAVQPGAPNRVWACNRDNGTVAVIDVATSTLVAEIPVGSWPRSLAFDATGSRVFVANQRGNFGIGDNEVSGFPAVPLPGSVSVIDVSTLSVQTTMSQVGVEPYGVAVSPNGMWFAVTGMRSGTVKLYDALTLSQRASFEFLRDLSNIPAPFTLADVDADRDGIADTGDPRGFTIRADGTRMYVTHTRSPFVSVLDISIDGFGLPTGITLAGKISTNDYPFDPLHNPVPVQILKSQGLPRFLEDIALSPDGTRALVPHVLHNVNHDVNHNFGPQMAGDFANRVYPALTMIDTQRDSYGQPGDHSTRLHHELTDPLAPAEYVPFGQSKITSLGDIISLGGQGSPVMGGAASFTLDGLRPGDNAVLLVGQREVNLPFGGAGILYASARATISFGGGTSISFPIANIPSYDGLVLVVQALVTRPGGEQALSNGVRVVVHPQGFGAGKMGYRAGHPGRVLYNAAGTRALMLNRGSEDLFLYRVNGSAMELMTVYPPRFRHVERPALSTTSPLGDLPLGFAIQPDPSTVDDDARVFVMNEVTRTLSVLRVNWTTGQISKEKNQIPTHAGPDAMTLSQRLGLELFEDASRAQTAGNFNNSCGSCHFEGGEDGNVWQRPAGPRSTMPMFGGTLGTGLILWKGVRLNSGETGPMFGGENGGHGIFTDAEQQALSDFHEVIPTPINPNRDPLTYALTPTARLGRDLFFGTNDTGMNPTLRHGGCAACHKAEETSPSNFPGPRFFTADFVNPTLSGGENLGSFDPTCFSLRENIVSINIRNVNTAANVDNDNDGIPDPDRNSDGYPDPETYAVMNADKSDDFERDDPNSYDCPCDPLVDFNCNPATNRRFFTRRPESFSIPSKLGVFATGPFFHDHVSVSLRTLLDPEAQALSPIYGSPAYPALPPLPGLNKIFNDVHDVRGHEQFVQNISKVQLTLISTNVNADIEALLAYIQSL